MKFCAQQMRLEVESSVILRLKGFMQGTTKIIEPKEFEIRLSGALNEPLRDFFACILSFGRKKFKG